MSKNALILTVILTGCNGESIAEQTDQKEEVSTISNNCTLNEQTVDDEQTVDAPIYLEPVFNGMTASYVSIDNATVHSVITEPKALADYEIDPVVKYRYKVRMDILLDNGLCASTWFWHHRNTGWSDLNYNCLYNSPVYSYDEAMMNYGDYSAANGDNFKINFPRSSSVYLEWNVG